MNTKQLLIANIIITTIFYSTYLIQTIITWKLISNPEIITTYTVNGKLLLKP